MVCLRYVITGYKANLVGDLMGLYHQESEQQGISWEEEVSCIPSPSVSPEHRTLCVRRDWRQTWCWEEGLWTDIFWACIIFQWKNAKSYS